MKGNFKVSAAKLEALIDLVSSGVLTISAQARALGLNPTTINNWKFRSHRNDPLFEMVAFGERMQFAKAYAIATRMAYLELRAAAEEFSILGRKRRTVYQGQFVPALDPAAIPLSVADRELLGYHPDALLLDEKGHATFVEEHIDAPVGLLNKFLETFADLQTTTNTNLNVKGSLTMGVTAVPKADYSQEPPPLPPAPVIPALEVLPDIVEPLPGGDDDLADLLGPVPVPVEREALDAVKDVVGDPDNTLDEPDPVVAKPQPVIIRTAVPPQWMPAPATPKPVGVDEVPARAPRNNLEADLFAKLREARARAQGVS